MGRSVAGEYCQNVEASSRNRENPKSSKLLRYLRERFESPAPARAAFAIAIGRPGDPVPSLMRNGVIT